MENREKDQLEESAQLYAEIFDEDEEAKEWIDSSIKDWDNKDFYVGRLKDKNIAKKTNDNPP